jgi:hypothetical protein
LAVPHRNPIHREKRVDPFNLAGFFPSGLRQSDQEPSGWWRNEGPEDSEEIASELATLDGDSSSSGVLFSREDQPAEAVIKREDKLGVLTICAHFRFIPPSNVITSSECSDWGTARLGGWDRGGVLAFALYQ